MPRLTPKLGQSRSFKDDTRYLSCEGCRARKTRCSRTESCSECELRRENRTKEEANLASSEREVARLARIVGRLEAHIQMLSQELIKERRARRELESKVNPGAEEKAASPPSADAPSSPSSHEGLALPPARVVQRYPSLPFKHLLLHRHTQSVRPFTSQHLLQPSPRSLPSRSLPIPPSHPHQPPRTLLLPLTSLTIHPRAVHATDPSPPLPSPRPPPPSPTFPTPSLRLLKAATLSRRLDQA
ncbi:hypothetical protein BCR35DRAFT_344212 [Leucosporidium creatinivorum]|uniref:Zn(2)-C6 fungal-type domain-containing protein n=1 Tax=Leucosporidium creatinivorum TaxID=106004 RepID=A0A1Y2EQH4_9BASI|nr:hypothetical protein BCR35DRAFT_344212 [Leucosporidium creatinivorum]